MKRQSATGTCPTVLTRIFYQTQFFFTKFLPNIPVIDAKRTCLPIYPQDFSQYAYGNAAIAMLDKFLVTGHTTEVRCGLLYHGIITGGV